MVIVAGVVLIASLYILRHKEEPAILRPDDERIHDYVKSRGGRVYASDIVNALGLPKSSVWKALKRLEAKGVIRTKKEGNRTVVEA